MVRSVLPATVALVVSIFLKLRLRVHGIGASRLVVSLDDEEVIVVLKVAAVMRVLLKLLVNPVVARILVVAARMVALATAARVTVVMSALAMHEHLLEARWEKKVVGREEHEEKGNDLEADRALAELHAPLG